MFRRIICGLMLWLLVFSLGLPAAGAADEAAKPGPDKELPYDIEKKRLDRAGADSENDTCRCGATAGDARSITGQR